MSSSKRRIICSLYEQNTKIGDLPAFLRVVQLISNLISKMKLVHNREVTTLSKMSHYHENVEV